MITNRALTYWLAGILTMISFFLGYRPVSAQTPVGTTVMNQPVVRAVMFWIDTCGHCSFVREEVLPPLRNQYGEQLEILLIELKSVKDMDRLYQTAAAFGMAKEDVGVPFLIIGDRVLKGSAQIPAELPGLIEQYLAAGGVDYPNISALADVLPTSIPTAAMPDITRRVETNASAEAILPDEPDGYWLAIGVMVFMITALLYTLSALLWHKLPIPTDRWTQVALPILALIGLGIASYLTYVETQAVSAMCGPVGDCNAVQASHYARLFGILPIGGLGMVGYLIILAAWGLNYLRRGRLAELAPLVVLGIALFGVLFSLYLTYLEPFVIRAVCIWCVSSAVIMTLLMLLALSPVRQVLKGVLRAKKTPS